MQAHFLNQVPIFISFDSSMASGSLSESTFEKYKNGHTPAFSAFRIYSTDVSSVGDSEKNQSEEHRVRGSYRKYTLEEKEEAVAKVVSIFNLDSQRT
jgi:hypothetical protein